MFHLFWHLWLISVRVDNLTPTFTLKTYSVFLAIHCSRLISPTFPWRNPVIQKYPDFTNILIQILFLVYMLTFSLLLIEIISTFLFTHQNLAHSPKTSWYNILYDSLDESSEFISLKSSEILIMFCLVIVCAPFLSSAHWNTGVERWA